MLFRFDSNNNINISFISCYLHDYMKLQYYKRIKIKLQLILTIKRDNNPILKNNAYNAMIAMANEFREKFCAR